MRSTQDWVTKAPGKVYGISVKTKNQQNCMLGYLGEWSNNSMTGHGIFMWTNASYHVGYFKNGLRHGRGTTYDHENNLVEGHWVDDELMGRSPGFKDRTQVQKSISYEGVPFGSLTGCGRYCFQMEIFTEEC